MITREEMRFLRRELINLYLHDFYLLFDCRPIMLSSIKQAVRQNEINEYGYELRVYNG